LNVENRWTLLRVLREEFGLTAAKCGCDMGECGACTVLLEESGDRPVLSCLMLAVDADGKKIRTLEGLTKNGKLHPIQEAFVEKNALMCGFCTPGTIMTTKAFLSRNPNPSEDEVRYALRGNLCRCGLYPRTIQGVLEAAKKMNGGK
jgi:aerobic-type carbon monoxide dehydrogenase small subunit (CoxS/CutS family)